MKKIVIAPDSFKGSLSAVEAAGIMAEAAREVFPEAEVVCLPIADGGEGLVDALLGGLGGERVWADVSDPLGRALRASYGRLQDGSAVIEMAAAAGLPLLAPSERNPLKTTSFGAGLLMRDALEKGCRQLYVGLGGSATVDGGTGAAAALGLRFLDASVTEVRCGGRLSGICRLEREAPWGEPAEIFLLNDVRNELVGPNGAAAIFGPQKGATPAQVEVLEAGLRHLAEFVHGQTSREWSMLPGVGAAGGFGLPFLAFWGAEMRAGSDFVLDALEFEEKLAGTDLVITGEGRTDAQSAMGKAISGVGQRCQKLGVPLVVLSGALGEGVESLRALGAGVLRQATPAGQALEDAMVHAGENLRAAARELFGDLREGRLTLR